MRRKRKWALGCMSFLVLLVGILLYLGWATKPPKQYEIVDLGPLWGLEDKEGELSIQGYQGLMFTNVRINDKGQDIPHFFTLIGKAISARVLVRHEDF